MAWSCPPCRAFWAGDRGRRCVRRGGWSRVVSFRWAGLPLDRFPRISARGRDPLRRVPPAVDSPWPKPKSSQSGPSVPVRWASNTAGLSEACRRPGYSPASAICGRCTQIMELATWRCRNVSQTLISGKPDRPSARYSTVRTYPSDLGQLRVWRGTGGLFAAAAPGEQGGVAQVTDVRQGVAGGLGGGVIGAEHALATGQGALTERDRLAQPPRSGVGGGEVAAGRKGGRVIRAEQPLAIGKGLLVQGDRLRQPGRAGVGGGEAAARGDGVRVVRAEDSLPVGEDLLEQGHRVRQPGGRREGLRERSARGKGVRVVRAEDSLPDGQVLLMLRNRFGYPPLGHVGAGEVAPAS